MRYLLALALSCLLTAAQAQSSRQVFSGRTSDGLFNLVISSGVPVGEEAFTLSFYESESTMQLRRTPYSTVSYTYAGIDASGTLHLERHFRWEARGIDRVQELYVGLGRPLAFATGYSSPPALLHFQEGENGVLEIALTNAEDFERPENTGF